MISIARFFDTIYICVNISYKNETRMNIMNLGEKEKGEGGCTSCSSYSCSDTKVTEFVDNSLF